MEMSRRTMLGASATAVLVVSAAPHAASAAVTAPAGFQLRRDGDVVGRITTGYQGWFSAEGDGSPIDGWWHWSNSGRRPTVDTSAVISWPDMKGYEKRYAVDMPPHGGGAPAEVFSSADAQTVDVQFRWMAENGIHTAAVQRFDTSTEERAQRDIVLEHVRVAAEKHGVKFFIMYDVSGWSTMSTTLPQDWEERMQPYVASPAYARQDGKPVVALWGFGFNGPGRPTPQQAQDMIGRMRGYGTYVIGGGPDHVAQRRA